MEKYILVTQEKGHSDLFSASVSKNSEAVLRYLGEGWTRPGGTAATIIDTGNYYTITFYNCEGKVEKVLNLDYSQIEYVRLLGNLMNPDCNLTKAKVQK